MTVRTKSFSRARSSFAETWDEVLESAEPTIITRKGSRDIVWMSRERYEAIADELSELKAIADDKLAIQNTAGIASDVFGPSFLADLRSEWPE